VEIPPEPPPLSAYLWRFKSHLSSLLCLWFGSEVFILLFKVWVRTSYEQQCKTISTYLLYWFSYCKLITFISLVIYNKLLLSICYNICSISMYLEYSQSVLSSCSNHQLPQSLTRRRKLYFVVFYMVVHVLSAVFASYSCSAFVFAEWFDFDPLFSSQSTHRLNCSSGIYLMMLLDNFYSCWLDGGRSCVLFRHIVCTYLWLCCQSSLQLLSILTVAANRLNHFISIVLNVLGCLYALGCVTTDQQSRLIA
jgi:hypothetical protein